MKISQSNFYTINDIIDKAISREYQDSLKENREGSLSIINEMTYINVWNILLK